MNRLGFTVMGKNIAELQEAAVNIADQYWDYKPTIPNPAYKEWQNEDNPVDENGNVIEVPAPPRQIPNPEPRPYTLVIKGELVMAGEKYGYTRTFTGLVWCQEKYEPAASYIDEEPF